MQRYMLWAPCTQSAVSMEKVEVIPSRSFKGNIVVQAFRKLGGKGEVGYHRPRFWQIYLYIVAVTETFCRFIVIVLT